MICPVCDRRWAPYPNHDFRPGFFMSKSGVGSVQKAAVNQTALDRWEKQFNRNKKSVCGECILEREAQTEFEKGE